MKYRAVCGTVLLLALTALIGGTATAQSGEGAGLPGLKLVNVQSVVQLSEMFDVEIGRGAVLSPDGTLMAWAPGEEICVLALEGGALACYPTREYELGTKGPLYWSPDSRLIAAHEDVVRLMRESDIWVLDVTTGRVINLTDDTLYGGFFDEEQANLDLLPVWNPVNGDLYFFRTVWNSGSDAPDVNTICRIRAGEGTPEQVADLTPLADDPFPVYEMGYLTLAGAAAISPDGTRLAMISRPQGNDFTLFSLWVLDLDSGQLQEVARQPDVVGLGLPDWYRETPALEADWFDGLAWADDHTLLVTTTNGMYSAETMGPNIYRVDVTTGEASILLDLSYVPDMASFVTDASTPEGYPAMFERQLFSVLLPGGDYVVYSSGILAQGGPETPVAFSALPVAPGDGPAQPVRLALIDRDEFDFFPFDQPSAGSSGDTVRVLCFGYLLTFERSA